MKKFILYIFLILIIFPLYLKSQPFDTSYSGLTSVLPTSFMTVQGMSYLGTSSNGLFYSTDNGGMWFPFYNWSGLYTSNITCLCERSGIIFAGSTNGIFKSTNLGYSWQRSDTGITSKYVTQIVSFGYTLIAGTNAGGVYLSTNNGLSWVASNAGLGQLNISRIKIYTNKIYLITSTDFYQSTDGAASWFKIQTFQNSYSLQDFEVINNIMFVAGNNGQGVYKSINSGLNWTTLNTFYTGTYVQSLCYYNNYLFVNNSSLGLIRSSDFGDSWETCNYRLGGASIRYLFIYNDELYASADYNGIYKTSNSGNSWVGLNNKYLPFNCYSGGVMGSLNNVAMISNSSYSVVVTTNSGADWFSAINSNYPVNDILIDSNRAYIVGDGLSYSTDNGIS
jgi:photosystem II stability/assembly factor-like uncharacterized protein